MDKKDITIIILIIIIILLFGLGIYHYKYQNQEIYHTVNISSTFSLDVPISNNLTKEEISENMYIVNDSENDILICSFNMKNASKLDLLEDGYHYLYMEESYKLYSDEIMNMSNHTVWYKKEDNSYITFFAPNNTEDNIMIVCHNNKTMDHMIRSVRVN